MGFFDSLTGGGAAQPQPQAQAPMPAGKFSIERFENENRQYTAQLGRFKVMTHKRDLSVDSDNAKEEYFMDKMNVRRRQLVIDLDESCPVVLQAGAMQWMAGNVVATSGIKGVGDLLGKAIKGVVTKETGV